MTAFRSPHRSHRRGGIGLEFALILPILMFLLLSIIDLSWMMFNYNAMFQAAREGARAMAVQEMTALEAEAVARQHLNGLDANRFTYEMAKGTNGRATAAISIDGDDASFSVTTWYLGRTQPDKLRAFVEMPIEGL